jgi:SAM-dependent methyltransferase
MLTSYRQRILDIMVEVLAPFGPFSRTLDFGCGDGWFSERLPALGVTEEIVPVDVQARRRALVEPVIYDGARLPFPDHSFDLAMAVDVLHHAPRPRDTLRELARCAGRFLVVKDHSYRGPLGWATLCALDEIGNRKFGVPSRYKYQRGWEWLPWLEEEGFRPVRLVHPARCQGGLEGRLTNRLQFVGLWRRAEG